MSSPRSGHGFAHAEKEFRCRTDHRATRGIAIGYGDLAPKSLLTPALAIFIGVCGVLLTALVAAIAVKALTSAHDDRDG
jgi:hypothetical protein